MQIVSLAALTVLEAGPAGHIRAAHTAGYEYAGLRLQPLLDSDERIAGFAGKEKDIESLLAETGIKPLEIGVFPIKADFDVEEYSPVLNFSHRIGARYITCPVEDTNEQSQVTQFAKLCDLALSSGLTALIEFNPYSGCTNLARATQIVQQSGRANAKLLIDVLHLSRSGGHPRDLAAIDPELIALVHLCDAGPMSAGTRDVDSLRRESRTARLYPGDGSLWLRELLAALPKDTPLSIEAPSRAHAHLTPEEKAIASLAATRRFLETQ